MIWRQDGDPPYTRRGWFRQFEIDDPYWSCPQAWPLARDLYFATAHEAADTVTQILSGDGATFGLGEYARLWRYQVEQEPERRSIQLDPEAVAIAEAGRRARKRAATRARRRQIIVLHKRYERLTRLLARYRFADRNNREQMDQIARWREVQRETRDQLIAFGEPT